MTQQAELINKIEKIPPKYFGEIVDFLGYLQNKAQKEKNDAAAISAESSPAESSANKPKTVGSDGKFHFTRKEWNEMLESSPITKKLTGILHTDMTLEEIRMARLAKHL
jgi:hypothetical protein